jgi:glycerol uptake facilitator-like aquaporin
VVDALAGGGTWANLWLYLVGPLGGALLAVAVFRIQLPADGNGDG